MTDVTKMWFSAFVRSTRVCGQGKNLGAAIKLMLLVVMYVFWGAVMIENIASHFNRQSATCVNVSVMLLLDRVECKCGQIYK